MSTPVITESQVRIFLMDRPQWNPLLNGIRWTAEMINEGMIMTVDAYNTMAPLLAAQYTIETFPYRYLLLMGTAGYLLKSAAINQANNQLSYQADGIGVDDMNKAGDFAAMGSGLWKEFEEKAADIKLTNNLAGAFGRNLSQYSWPGWYGAGY